MKKFCKNQQIYAVNKKNVQKTKKIIKFVHGTSITIYYTYMSPVYAFM